MSNLDWNEQDQRKTGAQRRQSTHLDFRNDLLFRRIHIPAIHHAHHIRLRALQERYRRPQHTFAAATCITSKRFVRSDPQRAQPLRPPKNTDISPVRMEEPDKLLVRRLGQAERLQQRFPLCDVSCAELGDAD